MVTAQPFGNTVDIGEIEGKYLKEMFESTTKEYYVGRIYSSLSLIQLSGKFNWCTSVNKYEKMHFGIDITTFYN